MDGVKLIVWGGILVTAHDQPAIHDGAVAIKNGYVHEIGARDALQMKYPGAHVLGEERFLLIPGLINSHSHGRGLTDFQRGAIDDTLETWRWETRKFIPVPVYDDVALSACKLLKSGVTATMHNHLLQDPTDFQREFEESIAAYRDTGLRVLFSPAIYNANPFVYGDDRPFLKALSEKTRSLLTTPLSAKTLNADNFLNVVRDLRTRYHDGLTRVGFGPIAPQWCTKELLTSIGHEAQHLDAMVHIHAAQTIFQKIWALETLGKSLVQYLKELGLLGPNLVIGHCVFPTAKDIEILAETNTGVTHHPSCNLRVRNGIAPAYHMMTSGVRVGLGLDGKGINDDDDFLQEMKVCYLLHRVPSLELDSAHMGSRDVMKMATEEGSILVGYQQELGRLESGRRADMVLLDFQEMCWPYVKPSHDPVDILLYRGHRKHVHTVIVEGRIVVQEGKVLTVDEKAIGNRLAEAASRPKTSVERARQDAFDEVRTCTADYYRDWSKKVKIEPYFHVNSRIDG